MPRVVPGSSIAVSYSSRGASMPAWMVQHVAAVAMVDGIDLDASTRFAMWMASLTCSPETPSLPIRSVWSSAESTDSKRVSRLIDATIHNQPGAPPLIVIMVPGNCSAKDLARTLQPGQTFKSNRRFAIGLSGASLRGGRPHLVQLGQFRRFAEEWDLSLAIDLSGRFDPTWEAEAAIARLGDRLAVLRLPVSAPSRAAVGRDRVACRALHAAIDRAGSLDVALSTVRSVPFPVTPRAAGRSAGRAAHYVAVRAALHSQALRDGITRYEGTPTIRGF